MKKFEKAIVEIMEKYESKELKYDLAIDKLYAVFTDTEGPQKELGYYLVVKDAEPLTEIEKMQIKKKVLESVIEIMENRMPRLRSPYSIRNAKNKIENLKSEIRQITKALKNIGVIEKRENIFLNIDNLTSEQYSAYTDIKDFWDEGIHDYDKLHRAYARAYGRASKWEYFDDIFEALSVTE